jgi:hypothetical protein
MPAWRHASKDLARTPLVLAAGGASRGRIRWWGGMLTALLVGAAASHFYGSEQSGQGQTVALKDLQQAEQGLEQARLQLRLAEAHGAELERQIDALNLRLRKTEEELAFFRHARDVKP